MRTIYHLPNHLDFPEKVTSDQRLRLQKVIVTSIRRAAQSRSNGGQRIERESAQALSPTEEFTAQRLSANGNSYAVPSYDDGGAPKAVPIKRTTAAPQPPRLRWRHPKGAAADDNVISGGSPFDDQLIAIFPHWEAVRVKGDRYAVSNNLRRAITWGNLLFGARSYAILEGPRGKAALHYYVVCTTGALHVPAATPGSGLSVAGGEVWGVKQRIYWQPQLHDDHHGFYTLRALFTAEGQPMWPMSPELAEEFYSELKLGKPQEQVLPPAVARPLVFGEIDGLVAADKTDEAARKLAELDASAFALVDWSVKARYLEILTDAWTLEAEEKAIIEILKSMSGRAELDAALALLKKKDKFDKLFRDINSQRWSLLVEVGKRFGDTVPFSYRELVHLLQDAGLVPRDWKDIAKQITLAAAGPILNPNLFVEAEEAARSFVEFLGGALEGLVMLVAHPDRLIEGIAQLVKLSVMVQLAEMGYQPAVDFVANILKQLAPSVVYGMKGAAVLGIGESLLRRVKWAIIWEVASWFIGIGEIKAAITGAGVSEKLAAQMDNGSAGSLFERWVNKQVFGRQIGASRTRLRVRMADNPHLEPLWQDRVSDVYLQADGSVWDAKIYQSGSEIDVAQLDDYRKMEEAGFVINGDGQRQTIRSINYIFSDRAAAEANKATLHVQGGVEAWFVDDQGVLQHLP